MLSPPPSPPSFRIFRACYLGTLLLLFLAVAALIPGASAASCVDEFEPCATDKNCCGRRNQGQSKVECVMGHANQTIVTVDVDTGTETSTIPTTCKSKRSQAFDTLSYEQEIASHRMQIAFFLEFYVYHDPHVAKLYEEKRPRDASKDRAFFFQTADEYLNNFARLVVDLEKDYDIKDKTMIPILLRDFLSWREGIDIKSLLEGKFDDQETIEHDYAKKGGGWDDDESEDEFEL